MDILLDIPKNMEYTFSVPKNMEQKPKQQKGERNGYGKERSGKISQEGSI